MNSPILLESYLFYYKSTSISAKNKLVFYGFVETGYWSLSTLGKKKLNAYLPYVIDKNDFISSLIVVNNKLKIPY